MPDRNLDVVIALIVHTRLDAQSALGVRLDVDPVLDDMHRTVFVQPDVAIDAGAFVEPALAQRGIDAHGDDIGRRVRVQEVGDVDGKRRITAFVATDDIAVDHDDTGAEHAVEFQADATAHIGGIERKGLAVPTDAGFRIVAAQGLVAMVGGIVPDDAVVVGHQRDVLMHEGQFDRPVVRQVDQSPRRIVELGLSGIAAVRPLLRIGTLVLAEIEILGLVVEMAEGEAPAFVQTQTLPRARIGGLGASPRRRTHGAADNGQGGSGRQKLAAIKT